MNNLYNTVLGTYRRNFSELTAKSQFHFTSRLYLWHQEKWAHAQLRKLEADFTANGQPRLALQKVLASPLPVLRQTGYVRAPYFERFPQLSNHSRALFRLLFMYSIYDIDARPLFYKMFDKSEVNQQRNGLLNDREAMARLSTYAVNFLFLIDRFIDADNQSLPLEILLKIGQTGFASTDTIDRQLQCYFFTHCIIAESLFYLRPIPLEHRQIYLEMIATTEHTISKYIDEIKLDNMLEFLVCCRILQYSSPLETRILKVTAGAMSPQNYLIEPLVATSTTLGRAEHRNVLFLMAQRPFQPMKS